ncbi:MAG: hypothetical protein ABI016_03895 [Chthoniobacterales bacterium]
MQTTITRVVNPTAPPSPSELEVQSTLDEQPAKDSPSPLWTWFIENPRGLFKS